MDSPDSPPATDITAAVRRSAVLAGVCVVLSLLVPPSLSRYYFVNQDLALLAVMGIICWFSLWGAAPRAAQIALSGRMVAAIALLTCAIGYAGHYWLLAGYALTRDEQMALFDAQIFASGHLTWPLPPQWQTNAPLLNTMFMYQVSDPVAWVSGYLPGNAMLHALVGTIADPALTGAILSGIAVVMTWLCAKRLWPGEQEPAAIAVLLIATSGQLQITGMTAYAMSALLAFNMIWLWLFLRDHWRSDIVALGVGFIATGLHQPLFHPLFAAPWLALLAWQRDWRRFGCYAVAYAAIGIFWLSWPHWQLAAVSGPASALAGTDVSLLRKLTALLANNGGGLAVLGANLVRFATWQAVLLVPLCVLGWIAARRDPLAAALAGGVVLTIFAMAALMAYQGHGFGYRYFHGLLGCAALLAACGWRTLGAGLPQVRTVFLRSLTLGLIITMPLQWAYGHRFYGAYAQVDRQLAAIPADYVVIGPEDAPFSSDLVFNRPDLSNRPLRLLTPAELDPATLARLICRDGVSVAMPGAGMYRRIAEQFGTEVSEEADKRIDRYAPTLRAAGCRVISLNRTAKTS